VVHAAVLTFAAALPAQSADTRSEAIATMKRDFKPRGIATLDRIDEDGVQAVCNRTRDNPPKEVAERLEQDQLTTIRFPADGKLLGDWKAGERIAQSGRGLTWSDSPGVTGGS